MSLWHLRSDQEQSELRVDDHQHEEITRVELHSKSHYSKTQALRTTHRVAELKRRRQEIKRLFSILASRQSSTPGSRIQDHE